MDSCSNDLAERVRDCRLFQWKRGMIAEDANDCVWTAVVVMAGSYSKPMFNVQTEGRDVRPNLCEPGTVGCLWDLVQQNLPEGTFLTRQSKYADIRAESNMCVFEYSLARHEGERAAELLLFLAGVPR